MVFLPALIYLCGFLPIQMGRWRRAAPSVGSWATAILWLMTPPAASRPPPHLNGEGLGGGPRDLPSYLPFRKSATTGCQIDWQLAQVTRLWPSLVWEGTRR